MIAIDTSSFIAFLDGSKGPDVEAVGQALKTGVVLLPPMVLTEMLSAPKLPLSVQGWLNEMPLLDLSPGFWQRAGVLRQKVLSRKLKCRFGDALIAQVCIDHDLCIISRDKDFLAIQKYSGLKVL